MDFTQIRRARTGRKVTRWKLGQVPSIALGEQKQTTCPKDVCFEQQVFAGVHENAINAFLKTSSPHDLITSIMALRHLCRQRPAGKGKNGGWLQDE
jgi:hypothetical protein